MSKSLCKGIFFFVLALTSFRLLFFDRMQDLLFQTFCFIVTVYLFITIPIADFALLVISSHDLTMIVTMTFKKLVDCCACIIMTEQLTIRYGSPVGCHHFLGLIPDLIEYSGTSSVMPLLVHWTKTLPLELGSSPSVSKVLKHWGNPMCSKCAGTTSNIEYSISPSSLIASSVVVTRR